jgi:AcrR family transcriptional regulator
VATRADGTRRRGSGVPLALGAAIQNLAVLKVDTSVYKHTDLSHGVPNGYHGLVTAARHPDRSFRLAEAEIQGGGHICGLFEGPDDLYRQLLPFVVEGIRRGERAVHIVDPAKRGVHFDRLAAAGIEVREALDRNQLEVREWAELFLLDGRFELERTVRLLTVLLDGGRALGYPATRAIGFMEWALEEAPGVEAITSYEALLDVALRRASDAVVCAYDVRRHQPAVIVDTLAVHPYALVDGRLRMRAGPTQPRERILGTAARLFHRHGIGATGIDRVIAEAGVAKATFYRQFPTKEELVLAWIRDPATRWFDRLLEQAEGRSKAPAQVIPTVFDEVAAWLERDGYRGCPYLHTIAELADVEADHRVRGAAGVYVDDIRQHLRRAAAAAGADPAIGDEIHALLTGAMELAVVYRSSDPLRSARDAAVRLVGGAAPTPRRRTPSTSGRS